MTDVHQSTKFFAFPSENSMPTTANPLPQLIAPRLVKARERLKARLYPVVLPLAARVGPINDQFLPLVAGQQQDLQPITPGMVFGPGNGDWKQRWFRVEVPAASPGEEGRRHLRWDVQGESTVYLDGRPWAGLDVAHRHCPLPDHACTLWLDCGLWVTAMWVPGSKPIDAFGPRFDGCFLVVRDQETWEAYWDLECILQVLARLYRRNEYPIGATEGPGLYKMTHERVDPLTRKLLRAGDAAVDLLDTQGLGAFRTAMQAIYRTFTTPEWAPRASIIGMAHIDLIWLWPERVTYQKCIHTFATQLRLMERYPEFIFNQSQPALNRAIERLEPALAAEVGARISEGRWEPVGGFEVECDNQLPCGEALARCLAVGQRKFKALTGAYSDLCWLPDVFGYSTALPQILNLGGITRFYTTKMTWSAVTKFPYSSFVWRGADGSEVMTQLCSTIYNQNVEAEPLNLNLDEHRQVDVHNEMLVCVGYGDGGGGVTEEQLERARRFANLAGVPRVQWSSAQSFFQRMEGIRDALPTYQGELYLEYHRGTYTTQGELKRLYRRAETALQVHEAARVACGLGPIAEDPWRRLSFIQFHDSLPGSSIRTVYDEVNPELQAIGDAALAAAASELTGIGEDDQLRIFNPLPYARREVVEIPVAGLADIPMQAVSAKTALILIDTPAIGTARAAQALSPAHPVKASISGLDNGIVQAGFSAGGQLIWLVVDGQPLRLEAPAGLVLHADNPALFDAWDIDHSARGLGQAVAQDMPLTVVDSGPLRGVLRGTAMVGNSPCTVEYRLDAEARYLRVRVLIDWQEQHRLLKYHVRTGYRGRFARFGAPFGSILRPQLPGTQADEAMWEVPGSRWAAVTDDDGTGLAVVSAARFGFSCREGDLGLSLLRSPNFPGTGDGASDSPEFTDQGRHDMSFALGAHAAVTAGPIMATSMAAESLFTASLAIRGGRDLPGRLRVDKLGSLVPSWVMPTSSGDGMIVRFHETAGATGEAVIACPGAQRARLVDFLERDLPGQITCIDGVIRLPYRAYQVLGVRID
jgi:alpha-mannosidase